MGGEEMMQKERKNWMPSLKEKIADAFELPKDIMLDLSKIILYGNRVAVVENFASLTDYDGEHLILKTDKGTIVIHGRGIVIKALGEKEMHLKGEFLSIELKSKNAE